jgi:enoyl-CoA hydratase/carnithine racemase
VASVVLERLREEQIAVVCIDRPPLNALDEGLVTELAGVTEALAADRATRAVVVRSALDGVFMAGADLLEFEQIAAEPDRAAAVQDVFTAFAELPQPTVAAINGHALGGGLELALACDFRFLARADGTLIGLPEVRLGLIPGAGGTQRLTRLVGAARATQLIMKGLQLSPEEALDAGIVHFLVEPDELEERALDYAGRLARQAPLALRAIKRAIRAAGTPDGFAVEREAFVEVLRSEDADRGVKAFLDGEKPSFSGT